ncbi:hypothetical protein H735_12425 [Vibrio owensii CAIM 1854 = LMG 25443]|uniref:Uncharacterized protein n=1 Tax=Vibrio owensii CAIM 1854 = LMG 25443 TaxID=1229493 RepID=A0A0C1VS44_9VIBR|nr:hypothetical protein [Vibrio owensii]KIF52718.1 hypothetical protein H735_12425 [Vibrio owensii CAIM 1854 = LMG 25443]
MDKDFYLEQAIKALQSRQILTGKDGILIPLIKQEATLICSSNFNPVNRNEICSWFGANTVSKD